jgi:excinuclease ABC subunit A
LFKGEKKVGRGKAYEEKILEKLIPLQKVGLGYVQLGQSSNTLSGGEAQRVKLAYFLIKGNSANNTLFVFDEPTTGLHFEDVNLLLQSFNELLLKENHLVVIEHNTDVIACADYVIEIGPEGGDKGGNLVFEGTVEEMKKSPNSLTKKWLK